MVIVGVFGTSTVSAHSFLEWAALQLLLGGANHRGSSGCRAFQDRTAIGWNTCTNALVG
jgi:hypothetical protein